MDKCRIKPKEEDHEGGLWKMRDPSIYLPTYLPTYLPNQPTNQPHKGETEVRSMFRCTLVGALPSKKKWAQMFL
jgi:hypothetical protein